MEIAVRGDRHSQHWRIATVNRSVQLRANFVAESFYDQLLAVVEIEDEMAEPTGDDEHFRRSVTVRVHNTGPLWERFVDFWSRGAQPLNGRLYFPVTGLQVEHDYYPFTCHLNVSDFPVVRIVVHETFRGSTAEYFAAVRERNERVQRYRDAWDKPTLTGNQLRELTGLPRLEGYPHLDQPLDADLVAELRESMMRSPTREGLWRNLVI
jgi:hypothetical protein